MPRKGPSFASQKDLWDGRAVCTFHRHRLLKMLPWIAANRSLKLLDVACADGGFYDLLQEYRSNIVYTGIDISKRQLAVAKQKGYAVRQHDLLKRLPFPDKSFDIVTAFEIIEHLYDTDAFLRELRRVLKPGGRLILTTPNVGNTGDRLRLLFFGRRPTSLEYHSRPGTQGHIRCFDSRDMKELLVHNGFNILQLTGREFYLPLLSCAGRFGALHRFLADIFPSFSSGFLVIATR